LPRARRLSIKLAEVIFSQRAGTEGFAASPLRAGAAKTTLAVPAYAAIFVFRVVDEHLQGEPSLSRGIGQVEHHVCALVDGRVVTGRVGSPDRPRRLGAPRHWPPTLAIRTGTW